MRARGALAEVLGEYVCWGGPIVTRAEAYRDGKARGFDARMLDYTVFGRPAVEAPADPAVHLAFLSRIRVADGLAA